MNEALLTTDLPFPVRRGKVRDVYDLGEQLLIIASDRISAFDVVMPAGIPDKGKILTALSLFWFERFDKQFPHHVISASLSDLPAPLRGFARLLDGRFMLVKKARVIPIECVVRGYLAGSAWKEYRETQTVCGIALPAGMKQCERLPAPIFTPATKAETGHDENITFEQMVEQIGSELANELRERTLRLYSEAAQFAQSRGMIIADTKFEFGAFRQGRGEGSSILLIDEILTPDSTRFWPVDSYTPGQDQPSFDKQFLRNWLEQQDWNKQPPAPRLPDQIIHGTRQRYIEAYELITARKFSNASST